MVLSCSETRHFFDPRLPRSVPAGGIVLIAKFVDARLESSHLAVQWNELTRLSGNQELAASAGWFWPNLDWISPPECQLGFIGVGNGDRIAAMFPIELRESVLSGVRVRCRGFIGGPYAVPDTAVLVGDDVEGCVNAFVTFLFDQMRDWRCFLTEGIDCDSRAGRAVLAALASRGNVIDRGSETRPYISFTGGWDGYLASRSSNFRRNLRRAARDISRSGHLEYRSAPPGTDGMDIVESIDRRSWRMAKPGDVETNTKLVAYCRNLQRVFADPDFHVVRYLTLDQTPVASLYGFIHHRVFYAIKVNYDLAATTGSPGFTLLTRAFEVLAGQGIERIELLGRNEYLQRLGNASHRMSRCLVFNRSAGGRALELAASVAQAVRSARVRLRQKLSPA